MLDQHCRLVIQGPEKIFTQFYKSFPIFIIFKKNNGKYLPVPVHVIGIKCTCHKDRVGNIQTINIFSADFLKFLDFWTWFDILWSGDFDHTIFQMLF